MKTISIDLGAISQYSINGCEDTIINVNSILKKTKRVKDKEGNFERYKVGEKKGEIKKRTTKSTKFDWEAKGRFISHYKDLLDNEKPDLVIYERDAGLHSKFSMRNFGFMEGVIETLCKDRDIKIIKYHITWNGKYHQYINGTDIKSLEDKEKTKWKERDAQHLYFYHKLKEQGNI